MINHPFGRRVVDTHDAKAGEYLILCDHCGKVIQEGYLLRLENGLVCASHGTCPVCLEEVQQKYRAWKELKEAT